ncbi:unnamed protein product [Clavelina lepadiformis]|uniref:Uncharacterized protein n=1 Tax=Clavelina lepadiformis TaxID=159417 RepID=A0ABP0G8K1_CLALP
MIGFWCFVAILVAILNTTSGTTFEGLENKTVAVGAPAVFQVIIRDSGTELIVWKVNGETVANISYANSNRTATIVGDSNDHRVVLKKTADSFEVDFRHRTLQPTDNGTIYSIEEDSGPSNSSHVQVAYCPLSIVLSHSDLRFSPDCLQYQCLARAMRLEPVQKMPLGQLTIRPALINQLAAGQS